MIILSKTHLNLFQGILDVICHIINCNHSDMGKMTRIAKVPTSKIYSCQATAATALTALTTGPEKSEITVPSGSMIFKHLFG